MKRLNYIDWMRGLACVVMFQAHCYDAWLNPAARKTAFFAWSRLIGTLPAPLFIFLAGISVALVTEKLREKGIARNDLAKQTILRGSEIFGLGLLFRLQEFLLGYPYAPWTDLLRVDVLNILGLSMMLLGALCWLVSGAKTAAAENTAHATTVLDAARSTRTKSIFAASVCAVAVALATPVVWTTARPRFLPWPLESYINGVHIYNQPQPWLFPLFPWTAFAFTGLAVGFWMFTRIAKQLGGWCFAVLAIAGAIVSALSVSFDHASWRWFAEYDYWHTSPNFFLMRCGILLGILAFAYAWCRWGFPRFLFSPIAQLGKTSLLVYWVHIEFVYGRFSILPKGRCGIPLATAGLAAIFAAMLGLSVLRTRWKTKKQPKHAMELTTSLESMGGATGK